MAPFEKKSQGSGGMNPLENNTKKYECSDLNLASFLYCREFKIAAIRRDADGRTGFVFEDSPGLRQAIVEFANDGKVPARTFCNTLRDLKALTR